MNKFLLALPFVLVVGCASKPTVIEVEKSAPTPVAVTPKVPVEEAKIGKYDGPMALSRSEVIEGSRDCVNSKMKPTVEYLSQKTGKGVVMIPVNVHCDPYK
jgi:hypothetical protein